MFGYHSMAGLFDPLTLMSDQKNFSLQYQWNIKQTSDENKEKYQED